MHPSFRDGFEKDAGVFTNLGTKADAIGAKVVNKVKKVKDAAVAGKDAFVSKMKTPEAPKPSPVDWANMPKARKASFAELKKGG